MRCWRAGGPGKGGEVEQCGDPIGGGPFPTLLPTLWSHPGKRNSLAGETRKERHLTKPHASPFSPMVALNLLVGCGMQVL